MSWGCWSTAGVRRYIGPGSQCLGLPVQVRVPPSVAPTAPWPYNPKYWLKVRFSLTRNTTCLIGFAAGIPVLVGGATEVPEDGAGADEGTPPRAFRCVNGSPGPTAHATKSTVTTTNARKARCRRWRSDRPRLGDGRGDGVCCTTGPSIPDPPRLVMEPRTDPRGGRRRIPQIPQRGTGRAYDPAPSRAGRRDRKSVV